MRRLLVILLTLFSATALFAQGAGEVRINEVLVKNVDSYMDDYGHRSSWVELHNAGYSKVDIGDCYLRVVKSDGTETIYPIPKGDSETVMKPQSFAIFYCDGVGTRGTFYTNFTLEDVVTLEFLDPGQKKVHAVEIDYQAQKADVSIGYITNEDGKESWVDGLPETTPNATNNTIKVLPRSEKFKELDPTGGMMTLIAIVVVLSVLALLFLVFKAVGSYNVRLSRKKMTEATTTDEQSEESAEKREKPDLHTGELVSAIALALYAYREELHDRESNVLTMHRVTRAYSPWSSKIYGLRQLPSREGWKK